MPGHRQGASWILTVCSDYTVALAAICSMILTNSQVLLCLGHVVAHAFFRARSGQQLSAACRAACLLFVPWRPPLQCYTRLFSQPPTIQQTTSSHGLALQIPHHDPSLPRDSARAGARGGAASPSNMAFLPFGSLACQPQNRFSDFNPPARQCTLWFAQ